MLEKIDIAVEEILCGRCVHSKCPYSDKEVHYCEEYTDSFDAAILAVSNVLQSLLDMEPHKVGAHIKNIIKELRP